MDSAVTPSQATINHDTALVWDMHACLPLRLDADVTALDRYTASGATFVSVNVGMDFTPLSDAVKMLAHFRAGVLAHPDRYVLVQTADDVLAAQHAGKLGVAFDLEGASIIDGQLSMLALLYRLGVRCMLLAYNRNNALAAGCAGEDTGLTALGRQVIVEMNAVGMMVDCTHTGHHSSLEIMEVSTQPVIFSHSNPAAVWEHFRNIKDDQIRACAATGGVIGITGVSWFLGDQLAQTEALVRHIDYVAQLVGPQHVGLGLDYVVDQSEAQDVAERWPQLVPPGMAGMAFARPEQLPEIAEALLRQGYTDEMVSGVMGRNFLRVARQVWQ